MQNVYVILIHWSPDQLKVKELKPFFTIILGYSCEWSKPWLPYNIISPEGTEIDFLAPIHGLQQLTPEPTHPTVKLMICTDVIFIDQLNMAVEEKEEED